MDITTHSPVDVDSQKQSFATYYGTVEVFADECNRILRERGFRTCEAFVQVNWLGQAMLVRSEMTATVAPNGLPLTLGAMGRLPLPTKDQEADDILTDALTKIADEIAVQCAKRGLTRLTFMAYAKRVTDAATTEKGIETNGRRLIVTP